MALETTSTLAFLQSVHPYDAMAPDRLAQVAAAMTPAGFQPGAPIYALGEVLAGLCLIVSGEVTISDANGVQVSALGPRNSFGERGLLRDRHAVTSARAKTAVRLLILPAALFETLLREDRAFARYFDRVRPRRAAARDLAEMRVGYLMAPDPAVLPARHHRAAGRRDAARGQGVVDRGGRGGAAAGHSHHPRFHHPRAGRRPAGRHPGEPGDDARSRGAERQRSGVGRAAPDARAADRPCAGDRSRQLSRHHHPDRSDPATGDRRGGGGQRHRLCRERRRAWRLHPADPAGAGAAGGHRQAA